MYFFEALDDLSSRTAIVHQGQPISFDQLIRAANEVVAALPPGRLLVFLECHNSPESLAAYLGCLRHGHVVHLFGEASEASTAQLAAAYNPNAIIQTLDGRQSVDARHTDALDLHPDLAVLLSTSGSTGSPKFVKLSKANLEANARSIIEYLGITDADRAITSLKFNYSYGMSVINSHWAAGAALVLTEESVTSPAFWDAFAAGKATSFAGVPYTFEQLARLPHWGQMSGLRTVTQAGGRLLPSIARSMAALGRANGWDFFMMYGQTEAAPRMAYLPPPEVEANADCIGQAVPGGSLTLVDAAGRAIGENGVVGQLRYSGPNVMMGYATCAADLATDETPEFLLTGDLAERTPEGLYRIVGRSSRIIKPFGVRVNLDEVEQTIRQFIPDARCAGNDEGVVVAYPPGGAALGPEQVNARVAGLLNLPAFAIRALPLKTMPLLENGKPNYRAMLAQAQPAARSPAKSWTGAVTSFVRRFGHELASILGLATTEWTSVSEIYRALVAKEPVGGASSFTSLAGDSLSYVQTMLALEDYLGSLPAAWENLTVDELEEVRRYEGVH